MMTDPIADMLTRIRNAHLARKKEVVIPFSKLKFEIAKILKHEDYIASVEKAEESKFPQINIELKYNKENQPSIKCIERVSRPGKRIYAKKDAMPRVLNGLGIAIISTPQGLMTDKQARRQGVGGEVMCQVW